tara:strand:- start:159 stop:317 length:159 start_codon:yes stop_codon:yes gene_type:complete
MSKSSSKQKLVQLKEWLKTLSSNQDSPKKVNKFSKADHYKKTRERHGFKKVN